MELFSVQDKDTWLRDSDQFQSNVDMPNLATDLGLGVGLSTSKVDDFNNLKERPVQLELLPLWPLARKAAVERNSVSSASPDLRNLWQTLDLGSRKNSLRVLCHAKGRELDTTKRGRETVHKHCHAKGRDLDTTKRGRETVPEFDTEHEYQAFEMSCSRGGSEEEGINSRKKLRLSKEQSALLEENFKQQSTLNPKRKIALARQLNLTPRQVEVWFQNRRARTKLKQNEVECELLKCCWENLIEENRRLHKELQDLQALKVAQPGVITHDFRMPLPATTLTMCSSDFM